MFIGIDIGNTLTKGVHGFGDTPAVFSLDYFNGLNGSGDRGFASTADAMVEALLDAELPTKGMGVTGAGANAFLAAARRHPELRVHAPDGDAISREMRLQIAGTRALCRREGAPLTGSFLLVSIGTGTSFTRVDGPGTSFTRFPIGSDIGGGYLLARAGGDHTLLVDAPLDEAHGHLLMKERFPDLEGSLEGEYVLAAYGNMGRPGATERMSDAFFVAKTVVERLMLMKMIPGWQDELPVVCIGTSVGSFPQLRACLQLFFAVLGKDFRIPENAGFAGALGAYEYAREHAD